jgi:hypothetical protein
MRYVSALILAVFVWVASVLALGMLIGQAFDGVKGPWEIVPAVGIWGTSIGLAGVAFFHSLKQSRPK